MSDKIKDGGPAFPNVPDGAGDKWSDWDHGMTLRQYAAIKLRVPKSGTEWLDEMIRESLRNDIASKAMQGALATFINGAPADRETDARLSVASYMVADAMLYESVTGGASC